LNKITEDQSNENQSNEDQASKDQSIMDERFQALQVWVEGIFGARQLDIQPASADASFRRYFRVMHDGKSYIIMDAPPEKEDSEPFVRISGYLADIDLNVPRVIERSVEKGFYLLTDLGRSVYLEHLTDDSADKFYSDAMHALSVMHQAGHQYRNALPVYARELLHTEMSLFSDWYLGRHHQVELNDDQLTILESTYALLSTSALEQPNVFVHRDYHSRNLMLLDTGNPGILDFQDAVWGPVTYDLVSLLRDCYITWPRQRVESWVKQYYAQLSTTSLLEDVTEAQFLRWFDLMGIQRHLKASGIFARLNYRDGKPGYLNDIPRTMDYVFSVASDYAELKPFLNLLDELDIPDKLKQQTTGPST